MSSSKAKKPTAAVTAKSASTPRAPAGTAREGRAPGPIDLFVSGDALAARRAAEAILVNDEASEAQRAEARELLERCAPDRPTLYLFASAWIVVLAIVAALYLF